MDCSVVIPCHGGAALTRACIDSLLAQQGGPPTEILLVDNARDDATARLADLHPTVRVLAQPHNRGFAGGVNVGWRAARAGTVLVLNNDTQAAENLLFELDEALASGPGIGAVAPVSNRVKGPAQVAVGDRGTSAPGRATIAAQLQHAAPLQDVDTLAGLCLLLRRSTLVELGGFDERFGHGNFEDDDLSLRLRLAGYRLVIARRAFVHHEGHATFRALGLDLGTELRKRRAQFVAKWRDDDAGRAVLAAWQHDDATAAESARTATRRHPRWLDADWHIAKHLAARGEVETAAAHFTAFLRLCPQHTEAAIELGLCLLRAGHAQRAGQHLSTTLENQHLSNESFVHLWSELGRHAYQCGLHDDAGGHFEDALTLSPDDGELHNWLGLCQLARHDLTAASASFQRALEAGFALAATNLGICQHRAGDLMGAEASFAKAVELLPRDPIARANHDAMRSRKLSSTPR